MERIEFKTTIQASREKIWGVLWSDKNYRAWTKVFSEGSHAITDWKEGSKVLFLDGTGRGMVSMIVKTKPNEFMSFKHMGEVNDDVEDITSDKVKEWAGSMENYTLKDVGGKTELTVEMDISDAYKDYFVKTWPKALEQIKALSEN